MKLLPLLKSIFYGFAIVACLWPAMGEAAVSAPMPIGVADLKFSPIPGKDSLSTAIDEQGNRWIKGPIPVENQNVPLVFHIPSIQVVDYALYADQGNGFMQVPKNINHAQQRIQPRYPLYFFKSRAPEYYLRLANGSIRDFPIAVHKPTEFVKMESINIMRNSFYYGLAIMSIIFNFVLYYIFRDRRFIIYSFLQLSLFVIFLYQDGVFYFLSQGRFVSPHFLVWNIALCATLSTTFAYYFLSLRRKMPYFKRLAVPLTVGMSITVLCYTLTDILFFRHLASVFFYALPGICLYQAVRYFRQDVYARFLVLSFGLVAVVSACFTLNKYFDSTFLSYFDLNAIRFASALEMICISLALVFKVKTVQEENEDYKERLNRYLYELEALKKVQHTYLQNGGDSMDIKQEVILELKQQYDLTDREVDVLLCIWNRMTNQEIGDKLFISINTTKYHIRRLYLKLEVNSREEVHQIIQSTFTV